ncbi:MAG: PhoU domain-containing protein, partial [Dehalococcoidia bacterium]
MARTVFEQHLTSLRQDVLDLGSMAERAIRRSMESIRLRDLSLARAVVDEDYEINRRRYEIE